MERLLLLVVVVPVIALLAVVSGAALLLGICGLSSVSIPKERLRTLPIVLLKLWGVYVGVLWVLFFLAA